MQTQRMRLALILLCIAGSIGPCAAADSAILSRAQLETHLREHAADTPLNALSPGARERFLMSLSFDANGVTALDAADLMDELTQEQILAVLSLFGPRALENPPPSHYLETRRVDKRRANSGSIGAIERRYNQFYGETRFPPQTTDLARAQALAAAFDARLGELFTTSALHRVDDHELRLLRTAARRVATQARLARYVDTFRAIFGERVRRNLTSSDDVETLQGLLLAQHRVPEARRLARDHPLAKLPPLPEFIDTLGADNAQPTVWRFDATGKRLTRAVIDLAPLSVIVTGNCELSREAAADIDADPTLGPLFARHAQWLVPEPGIEAIPDAIAWNREFPRAPVAMIYARADFGVLPDWGMPQFYIVRNGAVIDTASGWWRGSPEARDQLLAALRRSGLLPGAGLK